PLGLVTPRARLLQFLGAARCMLGDPTGIDALRASLELGLQSGIGPETTLAYTNLAGFLFDAEGPRPALALYAEGIEFGERRGLGGHGWGVKGGRVWPLFSLGGGDGLEASADEYRAGK